MARILHREGNPPAARKNPNLYAMKVRLINGVRVIDRGCRNAPRSNVEEVVDNDISQTDNLETTADSSSHRETTRKSRRMKNKSTDDSKQCLYCQRVFTSQRGLSQHIPHCKAMNSVPR